MDQAIKDRYSPAILAEAQRRYAIAPDRIRPLDAFESFIYAFERDEQAYILRLGHSLRRSPELIAGEADWLAFLAAHGASVARPILSANGRLVESIADAAGGHFLATAFTRARGRSPGAAGWTPALYERYGRVIGQLHALTQLYQPATPEIRRPAWDDESVDFVARYLPASEDAVHARYAAVMAHLRALPTPRDAYGLIHQDAHGGNFFVDDAGAITLFDFDDCADSWFVNDIALVVFYYVAGAADPPALTRAFLPHFLSGYRQMNTLDPAWLAEIPYFLKLREIDLYAIINRDFDPAHNEDAWSARFMRGRKERIVGDVPVIDVDFAAFAADL